MKASEEKFSKLREVYSKLRTEHIQLLRMEGEGRKKLQEVTREVKTAEDKAEEEAKKVIHLKMELEEAKALSVSSYYHNIYISTCTCTYTPTVCNYVWV